MSDREWIQYQKRELSTRMKDIVDIDRTEVRRAGDGRDSRDERKVSNA